MRSTLAVFFPTPIRYYDFFSRYLSICGWSVCVCVRRACIPSIAIIIGDRLSFEWQWQWQQQSIGYILNVVPTGTMLAARTMHYHELITITNVDINCSTSCPQCWALLRRHSEYIWRRMLMLARLYHLII